MCVCVCVCVCVRKNGSYFRYATEVLVKYYILYIISSHVDSVDLPNSLSLSLSLSHTHTHTYCSNHMSFQAGLLGFILCSH